MIQIKLPTGTFDYDSNQPLGKRGGFGQVFLGKASNGEEVAVKKLHVSATDAGHRELQVADELRRRVFEHVIPFIDAGEDADSGEYFVVMPKADGSLQTLIDKRGAQNPADTAFIMLHVTKGLLEVKDLVHRDLKPDNVLFHQGKWKVADFGIARFVEKVTSANTLKEYLTPPYAAPEQWRSETATYATDVYALGCIGFCLLTGQPPFTANPQQDHQFAPVPDFTCADSRLKQLIKHMLRKPPQSRPSLSRVESFLAEIVSKPHSPNSADPLALLASAGAQVADHEQQLEAQREAAQKARNARNQLATTAFEILSENVERLWAKVQSTVVGAQRASGAGSGVFEVWLGGAVLTINIAGHGSGMEPGLFRRSGWDVVAMSTASVKQTKPDYEWSASLWYAKLTGQTEYRWYEVGYFTPFGRVRCEPRAAHDVAEADLAPFVGMGAGAVAYGPWPADDEQEDKFHERWIWLLAKAAVGKLNYPTHMPFDWPPQLP